MRRLARIALAAACVTVPAVAGEIPLDQRRSGYEAMGAATRAMQDDDAVNPATFWLAEGEETWRRPAGAAGKACADCHGDAADSMKGVAARHPAFDPAGSRLLNLEARINLCRTARQRAARLGEESRELLSLTAWVARQSRGMPIAVAVDGPARPHLEAGRASYRRRVGQLNLSCSQCHDENHGRRLGSATIPQGHPTGYPLYRLEWQSVGSLQRRIRGCMIGVRADPYPFGARENVELEFYLMWRARGMPLETPAVRP